MKVLLGLFGCSALALVITGCAPELAQTRLGAEEEAWKQTIQASYPAWRPPQVAPPAIEDNMSKNYRPLEPAVETTTVTTTVTETGAAAPAAAEDLGVGIPGETVTVTETTTVSEQPVAPKAEKAVAAIPEEGTFDWYEVKKGESLSMISKQFYKDGNKYHRIIKANPDIIANPNVVRPGTKIRIPKP